MPIGNPFDELERLLEGLGRELETSVPGSSIAVDIEDRDDTFVVTADVPGFARDEVEVTIADSTVHIAAETSSETEEEEPTYVRRERHARSVSRSVQLPGPVDEDEVTASYRHGVLTVTLPKLDVEAGGTRIDIE